MEVAPYITSDHPIRNVIKNAFLVSISLVTFIFIFQPYDYNRLSFWVFVEIICLLFVSTFLVAIAYQITVKSVLPGKIWYKLIAWLFFTGLISQVIYFYTIFMGFNLFSWKGVVLYFVTSLSLSLVPFAVYLLLQRSSRIKHTHKPIRLNKMTFQSSKILMCKAEDNYVRIVYMDIKNELKSTLVRSTLKEVLKKVGNRVFLQVHRSYAINLDHFSHYTGNTKGYFVYLNHMKEGIPVSRSKGQYFLDKVGTIHHK